MDTSDWTVELPEGWKVTHGPVFSRTPEGCDLSLGVEALDAEPHLTLAFRLLRGEVVQDLEVSLEFPETFEVDGHTYPSTDRIYHQRAHGGLALTVPVGLGETV